MARDYKWILFILAIIRGNIEEVLSSFPGNLYGIARSKGWSRDTTARTLITEYFLGILVGAYTEDELCCFSSGYLGIECIFMCRDDIVVIHKLLHWHIPWSPISRNWRWHTKCPKAKSYRFKCRDSVIGAESPILKTFCYSFWCCSTYIGMIPHRSWYIWEASLFCHLTEILTAREEYHLEYLGTGDGFLWTKCPISESWDHLLIRESDDRVLVPWISDIWECCRWYCLHSGEENKCYWREEFELHREFIKTELYRVLLQLQKTHPIFRKESISLLKVMICK